MIISLSGESIANKFSVREPAELEQREQVVPVRTNVRNRRPALYSPSDVLMVCSQNLGKRSESAYSTVGEAELHARIAHNLSSLHLDRGMLQQVSRPLGKRFSDMLDVIRE